MNAFDMMLENATWTRIEAPPITDGSLYATHSGVLTIEGLTLKCWQLSDGRRMIDAQSMARLFGFNSPEEFKANVQDVVGSDLAVKTRTPVEFAVDKNHEMNFKGGDAK